jgi:hypothetical protein
VRLLRLEIHSGGMGGMVDLVFRITAFEGSHTFVRRHSIGSTSVRVVLCLDDVDTSFEFLRQVLEDHKSCALTTLHVRDGLKVLGPGDVSLTLRCLKWMGNLLRSRCVGSPQVCPSSSPRRIRSTRMGLLCVGSMGRLRNTSCRAA